MRQLLTKNCLKIEPNVAEAVQKRTPELETSSGNIALRDAILQRISESDRCKVPFAEFMELALYHPQHGYYAAARSKIGAAGDFFTAPHLGTDFGELLAEQFIRFWRDLTEQTANSTPFTLVEMGAGQGILAVDVLDYVRRMHTGFFEQLDYVIVERSPIHVAEQQSQLQNLIDAGAKIRWCTLEDIPADSVTGCFFSNELVDALPVHQIVKHAGRIQEVYVSVALNEQGTMTFQESLDSLSTPAIADYFAQLGIDLSSPSYCDGYRTEAHLAALDWLAAVAMRLHQGYVLTIDYGYPSDRYYHPARSQGTLQCYCRHTHHANPYANLGLQDITAHVNFTALQNQGEQCGLQTIQFTKQEAFLMTLGLGDRLAKLSQSTTTNIREIHALLQQRDALHSLINPMGLGNFGVLIQARGVRMNASSDRN
jgi:SAM-dependent MidA family methyltransferase